MEQTVPTDTSAMSESNADAVVLLHVSDVHFRKRVQGTSTYTADDDLRREVKNAVAELRKELGDMHAILITGDVAFAAQPEEYETADTWIRELCDRAGCREESVRTISGNHDVQRGAISESPLLRNAHATLRTHGAREQFDQIDAEINALLADKAAPELLFSSLKNYNDFAGKFLSDFNRAQPYWEQDIALNDRSRLRIRGLNSALVSNANDDRGENKLVLGPFVCYLPREEGVEYLVMCHHPPQWLWDQDRVEDYLNNRARIVLFGHKHVQRIYKQETNGQEVLRIHAGAVNPEPGAIAYEPRFNCMRLRVMQRDDERVLQVEVHRRVWDPASTRFIAATDTGGACQTFELKLGAWTGRDAAVEPLTPQPELTGEPLKIVSDPLSVIATDATKGRMLSAPRRLAYRFMALPYHRRLEVAQALNLLSDEDRGVSDTELFRRFFRRAAERSQLAALWRETEARHPDSTSEENPFSI